MRTVGVEGGSAAGVPGVPGVKQIKCFFASDFSDQDAVGAHAQCGFQQHRHADFDAGVVLDVVFSLALNLAGVLDDYEPLHRIVTHHLLNDGVDKGCFARASATNDENVFVRRNSPFNRFLLGLRHDPGFNVLS